MQGTGLINPDFAAFGWFIQINKICFVCDRTITETKLPLLHVC